ncbi:hypothetical protein WDW86_17975 [Bdellovibrionota bacterium FG-2]
MIKNKVRFKLYIGILILAVLPMATAYILVRDVVGRSLNLGFNPSISQFLDRHQEHLKELRVLKPERQNDYRREFEESRSLQAVYSDNSAVKAALNSTLFTYFAGGISLVFLAAVLSAFFLNRSVSRTFTLTLKQLFEQKDRVKYLEEISQ